MNGHLIVSVIGICCIFNYCLPPFHPGACNPISSDSSNWAFLISNVPQTREHTRIFPSLTLGHFHEAVRVSLKNKPHNISERGNLNKLILSKPEPPLPIAAITCSFSKTHRLYICPIQQHGNTFQSADMYMLLSFRALHEMGVLSKYFA
jgi:hypothetical protein